jgi:hypothetical protein
LLIFLSDNVDVSLADGSGFPATSLVHAAFRNRKGLLRNFNAVGAWHVVTIIGVIYFFFRLFRLLPVMESTK